MSEYDDRHIDFVTRHYKAGAFDTQKAIDRFNARHGADKGASRKVRRLDWRRSVAVAAAVALLFGLFLYNSQRNAWTEILADGAKTVCLLPDSTQVTLADGATLRYRNFDADRKVEMTGKIYFDVARDESRPFEVSTGNAYIKVLGTRFQVDASASRKSVTVYVESGKVLFARDAAAEGTVLEKGMGATLPDGKQTPVLDTRDKLNSLAWQRGTFIFNDTPLKEVLKILSEHYKVSFVCTDLSKRLSGEFSTDDLDMIITLIESALDVNIMKM